MPFEPDEIPIVVGMFLDDPPEGSIADTCDECGDPIVIGPDSQQLLARHPDALKMCFKCALKVTVGGAQAGTEVTFRRARETPGVVPSYEDGPPLPVDFLLVSSEETPFKVNCARPGCSRVMFTDAPVPPGKLAFCSPRCVGLYRDAHE